MPRLVSLEEDVLATNFPMKDGVALLTMYFAYIPSDEKTRVVMEWRRILALEEFVVTTARISNGVQPPS